MSSQNMNLRATESSAEEKVNAGIDRALKVYGPNLAAFFNAVRAEIKSGEHKVAVQMDLPLTKSK